jgi:glycosyltransferase involved in cell wall biosynthesis
VPAPFLSVVIPAYNAAPYLGEALESVLAETASLGAARPAEIIVIDDASRDRTAEIAAAYAGPGVRLISNPAQTGAGGARNNGVAAAGGAYLAFLDADDLWTKGRLARLFAALDGAGAAGIAFGHTRQFACPRMDPALRGKLRVPPDPMPAYCAGGMLLRRADFTSVGRFAEGFAVGEFIDWFARAKEKGLQPVLIDDVVLERRIHGANQSVLQRQSYTDYAQVLKRALDRRRLLGAHKVGEA